MIKIEKTSLIGRYNLVNTKKSGDDYYIRQLSTKEVQELGISIIKLMESKDGN